MKIFFDTNVYVAEALLGQAAEQMIQATERPRPVNGNSFTPGARKRLCNAGFLNNGQRAPERT